jgi:molybdopterin converting factor small subunit
LPSTLTALFPDLPRRLEVDGATVREALERLEEGWPGVCDRLCEPGSGPGVGLALRRHIHVYVDRERAGLDSELDASSRVDVITAISGG